MKAALERYISCLQERMSLRADELDASHLQRVLKRVLRFATSDDEPANAM